MQEQEATTTAGNKYEELNKLGAELQAVKDKFIEFGFPTEIFTIQNFKNLVDEKIVKLRSKLFECIYLVAELRDYFYIKEHI